MFFESILIALDSLRTNKLRSILTMLGIIIGVAAVITMVSLGNGVRSKMLSTFNGLGRNLLMVTPGAAASPGQKQAAGTGITLNYKDSQAIAREIDGVSQVSPMVIKPYQLVYGNQNWTTAVQGVTPEAMAVNNIIIENGKFFTQDDVDYRERVVVLGQTAVQNLFGEFNPIGQTVRINNSPFRVIGVLASKGQSTVGSDQDDIAMIPITTAQERLMGINFVQMIKLQAINAEAVKQVQEDITQLLRLRHRIIDNADDFTVRNLASLIDDSIKVIGVITLFLGTVAGISLLVGGIGIMNIMLVSVTERTREIGIRKALGATYRTILMQFLIEATVIGFVGGIIGIALGIGAAEVVSKVIDMVNKSFAIQPIVDPWSVIGAVTFSIIIGLFFGIYPARKAAKLDPIEALRYE